MPVGDDEHDQREEQGPEDDPSKGFGTRRDVAEDNPPPAAGFGTGASVESMLPSSALDDPTKGFGTSTSTEEAPTKDSEAKHEA
jgi:hypothetical protein